MCSGSVFTHPEIIKLHISNSKIKILYRYYRNFQPSHPPVEGWDSGHRYAYVLNWFWTEWNKNYEKGKSIWQNLTGSPSMKEDRGAVWAISKGICFRDVCAYELVVKTIEYESCFMPYFNTHVPAALWRVEVPLISFIMKYCKPLATWQIGALNSKQNSQKL